MRLLSTPGWFLALSIFVLAGCDDSTVAPYNVTIDPANFVTTIDNRFMPLTPGTIFRYEGTKDDQHEVNRVTVTRDTKVILGVTCVQVADSVFVDGKIEEATFDWFAQDRDGNVWYFGEYSEELDTSGAVVSTEGSWEAGVLGAQPGIAMLANPDLGHTYRQEFLQGEAEDEGHVLSLNESVTVPFGSYSGCLKTEEWTALEPGTVECKFYGPNVGMLKTISVAGAVDHSELVSVTTLP